MSKKCTLNWHWRCILLFIQIFHILFYKSKELLNSVPARPLPMLIDIAVCPLRLAYMKPPVLQFNNIYNLSAAAVSSDDIPTSYLIILSITGGASYKTDIPYPRFFTHVRELWLHVVSIFNTSVDVESFHFHPALQSLRFDLFIHSYWILSFVVKVSFTGTCIYCTTHILKCNWWYTIHWISASLVRLFLI